MINHARTLLANLPGTATPFDGSALGDEIIDPGYNQLVLPDSINRVRRVLFGGSPDREMLNYRCYQLLRLINETELQTFVTSLDARITYTFDSSPFLDESLFEPVIAQLAGDGKQFVVTGSSLLPPDPRGKLKTVLHVTVGDGPGDVTVPAGTGLVGPISIPGTSSAILVQSPEVGDAWRITWRVRPQLDLGQLLPSLQEIGGEVLISLFNRAAGTEPFLTFRRLFERHYDLPHRLGAAVMALIHKSEEVRLS